MPKKKRKRQPTPSKKRGWQQRFLKALAVEPHIARACRIARITTPAAYNLRKADPAFAKAWDEAIEYSVEVLEKEVWRRAVHGVKKGKWMKDKDGNPVQVETMTEYSDVLAMFILNARKPAMYRPIQRTEVTGADGQPLVAQPLVVHLTTLELPQPAKQLNDATEISADIMPAELPQPKENKT